jgi:hypothetical protein
MHNIVDVIENLNFEFSGKKLVNQFQVINFVKFVNFELFYFIFWVMPKSAHMAFVKHSKIKNKR